MVSGLNNVHHIHQSIGASMPRYYMIGGSLHGTVQNIEQGITHFQGYERVSTSYGRVFALKHLSHEVIEAGVVLMLKPHAPPYDAWLTFHRTRLSQEYAHACSSVSFDEWAEQQFLAGY